MRHFPYLCLETAGNKEEIWLGTGRRRTLPSPGDIGMVRPSEVQLAHFRGTEAVERQWVTHMR